MWEKIAVCIVWRRWHGKPGVCAWCDDYSNDSIVCELWHLHNRVCGDEATAIDVQWMCSNSNSSLFILVANNYWTVVHRHPLREEEQLAPCPDHLFHTAHKPPLPTWHTRRACCRNEQTTATHRFHIGYGRSEAGDTDLIAHRYCLLAVFQQFHSQEAVSTLKEVRGSFAILFWLPCATWHRVMTHTHQTQSFRSTDAHLRHSTPGPEVSCLEAFFFTPVDFLSVSRHDARAPLERTKDVDFRRVQLSNEWCLKARNGSGGNVDDVDRSTSRRVGAWSIFWTSPELFSAVVSVIFPFLCWWTWEWAVVRLLRRRWTPAQDSCWSRQRRLLDVDLVSVFTISLSAFLWQCCTSIFIFVVLHLCTRRMISRQSPLKQTDSSWILHLE